MSDVTNNPLRLVVLCDTLRQEPKGQPVGAVFAHALGIITTFKPLSVHEKAQVFMNLGLIQQLIDEVEIEIKASFDARQQKALLAEFSSLRDVFSPDSLGEAWASFAVRISDTIMNNLRTAGAFLPEESHVNRDELAAVRQKISSLLEDVKNAKNVSKDLRIWLMTLLSEIEESIAKYWARGPKEFRRLLPKIVGEFVITAERWTKEEKASTKPFGDRFMAIVNHVYTIATKADKTVIALSSLTDKMAPLIDYLPPPQ